MALSSRVSEPCLLDCRMRARWHVGVLPLPQLGKGIDTPPQLVVGACRDCIPRGDLCVIRKRRDIARADDLCCGVVSGVEHCVLFRKHPFDLLNSRPRDVRTRSFRGSSGFRGF